MILRIPHRGSHGAEVCRSGLENYGADTDLRHAAEQRDGKRDDGQQRHVVRHQHREEEAHQHQRRAQAAGAVEPPGERSGES